MSTATTSSSHAMPRAGRRENKGVYDSDEEEESRGGNSNSNRNSNRNINGKGVLGIASTSVSTTTNSSSYRGGEFKYMNRKEDLESDSDEKDDSSRLGLNEKKPKMYFDDDDDEVEDNSKNSAVKVYGGANKNNTAGNSKQFVPKDITKMVSNSNNLTVPSGPSKDSWGNNKSRKADEPTPNGTYSRNKLDEKENNTNSHPPSSLSNASTSKGGWNTAKPTSSTAAFDANAIRQKAVLGEDDSSFDFDDSTFAVKGDSKNSELDDDGRDKNQSQKQVATNKQKKAVNILDSSVDRHVPSQGISADALASHLLKLSMEHSFVMVAHNRGIRTPLVQCVIIRDKSSMHNRLYPTYELSLQENNKALILAQKQEMNRSSANYRLYDMTRGMVSTKLSKKSGNYLGKLKSTNGNGTEYVLVGNKETKEEFAGVVFDRMNILNQLKEGSQPRKMTVLLPKINPTSQEPSPYVYERASVDSMAELLKKNTNTILSPNFHLYETKDPVFEAGNYRLNFNGRVSVPSVKNFQLVSVDDDNDIICQFGKVGEDRFHLDFKAPMNAVQAFSLALCQFNI